jgi:hypothetical protein
MTRPVLRFSGALIVVGLLLAVVGVTGAARAGVGITGSMVDRSSDPANAALTMQNDGMFPITIVEVSPADAETTASKIVGPREVGAGETTTLRLQLELRCDAFVSTPYTLRLTVRTWAGVHRDYNVRRETFNPCPR